MNYFSEERYKGIINKIEEMAQIKMFCTIILYGVIGLILGIVNDKIKIISLDFPLIIAIFVIIGIVKGYLYNISFEKEIEEMKLKLDIANYIHKQ